MADGGDGLWMECELCDAPVHRVRLNEHGNGTGPWQEHREHLADSGHHLWRQEHNCQDPQPDACTFCTQAGARLVHVEGSSTAPGGDEGV